MSSRTFGGVMSAIAGVIALVVVLVWTHQPAPPAKPAAPGTGVPSASCVGVAIVSSQEKSTLLAQLAAGYDATHPKQAGTCVDVRVNTLASGSAETALAADWHGAPGPAPTVWSPAATSWLTLLRYDRGVADVPDILPGTSASLMQSPLVLAMPKPMAEAMGWPNTPVGWSDILKLAQDPDGWGRYGHPEWGHFQLGKTSPVQSTSGLHALVATYFAATGLSADLTTSDVEDPRVVAFVRGVEASVLHYGNTVSTFLDGLKSADQSGGAMTYVSAIATEETQILTYDAGHPKTPLVAIYPKDGTLVADHPYAILNSSWVTDAQRTAAATFLQWLLSSPQQARFLNAGFRDHDGKASPALTLDSGIVPAGPALIIKPPEPAVLAQIRSSWGEIRKRARVLMVIDTSGSMDGDKIEQVRKAGIAAVHAFAPDDELGLWTFSSDINKQVPIQPVGSGAEIIKKVQSLQAGGGTALYQVTAQAAAAVRQNWDPERINAVILLTDGQNDDAYQDLDGVLRQLAQDSQERQVPVFTIAYGSDADLKTLQRIAAASHGRSYDAPDPSQVGGVFADVVSNF